VLGSSREGGGGGLGGRECELGYRVLLIKGQKECHMLPGIA